MSEVAVMGDYLLEDADGNDLASYENEDYVSLVDSTNESGAMLLGTLASAAVVAASLSF